MTVEYGETQPMKLGAKTEAAKTIHEINLDKLKPYSRYFYRVTCEDADGQLARSDV
jgi:phosphodiesterase/alkaline phosphatase D-like protein